MNEATDIAARLRAQLGDGAVSTGEDVGRFRVDGLTPQCAVFPASVEELRRCAALADEAQCAVIPAGNGSRLGVGGVPRRYDVALSTRRLRRLLAHEAADMTATVEAGMTLAELNAALAQAGQWLPVDPPHPELATVGGVIAADGCGPLRLSQGKVRDLLIGVAVVLADGTPVRGGGRVVKNVAGYDLMKLFTGSFGTLGVIVEATFKVRPRPAQTAVFVLPAADTAGAAQLAQAVLAAPLAPLYVEVVSAPAAAALALAGAAVVVGCGGSAQEIAAHCERLAAYAGGALQACGEAEATKLYAALRDFAAVPPSGTAAVLGCRVSVLPSRLGAALAAVEERAAEQGWQVRAVAHAGAGVAVARFTGGAAGTVVPLAEALREAVRSAGGWVTFDALPAAAKALVDPWGECPGMELMRGIKETLDPRARFSPGRFVGGL